MDSLSSDNKIMCRACLENNETNMKSIYRTEQIQNTNIKFCTILNYCTNLDVYEGDGLPGQICEQCAVDVVKAFQFKQQFIRANAILRQKQSHDVTSKSNHEFEYVFVKLEDSNSWSPREIRSPVDDAAGENTLRDLEIINFDNTIHNEPQILNSHSINVIDETTSTAQDDKLWEKKKLISEKLKGIFHNNEMTNITDRAINSYIRVLKRKPKLSQVLKPKSKLPQALKPNPNLPQSYTCNICLKSLSSAASLKIHLITHSNTVKMMCNICGQDFKNKARYQNHIASHNSNASFKCEECNKSYTTNRNLKDHNSRVHNSGKSFVCGVCGKVLTQKVGLQKHMMIHTGEKPFHCDICGKQFRYKNVLVLHKRYHTGERPYSCSQCGQTFIGKSHYQTHLLIHTGVKPYSCDICGKCFNRRTNLRSHRKIHTDEREHICPVCDKGFIQNNCLRAHMVTHTQEKPNDKAKVIKEEQQTLDKELTLNQYPEAADIVIGDRCHR